MKLDKKEENESITSSGHISHYKEDPPFNTTLANLPRLALDTSATGLSTTSEIKDSVEKQPVAKPSFTWEHAEKIITFSYSSQEFTPQKENREMENDVGRVSRTTTGTKPIQVDDNTTL